MTDDEKAEEVKRYIDEYKAKIASNNSKAQKLDDDATKLEAKLKAIKAKKKLLIRQQNQQYRKERNHVLIEFATWILSLFPHLNDYQKQATQAEEIKAVALQIYWYLRHAKENGTTIVNAESVEFDKRYIDTAIKGIIRKQQQRQAKAKVKTKSQPQAQNQTQNL